MLTINCCGRTRLAGCFGRFTLFVLITLVVAESQRAGGAYAVDAEPANESSQDRYRLDFSDSHGGSVEQWLRAKGFTFEKDAKKRELLGLSIADGSLILSANGPLSGFIVNDGVKVGRVKKVRLNWGVVRYPADVAYSRQVNNEALMVYFFFGNEKVPSGHMLIPNSPYFIGLYLCRDDRINFPYKGRYFHAGGRFVCLGTPKPNEIVVSEFDLDSAFKRYFQKTETPDITGIAFGIDTSKAGAGGKAAAVLKSIEFVGREPD